LNKKLVEIQEQCATEKQSQLEVIE